MHQQTFTRNGCVYATPKFIHRIRIRYPHSVSKPQSQSQSRSSCSRIPAPFNQSQPSIHLSIHSYPPPPSLSLLFLRSFVLSFHAFLSPFFGLYNSPLIVYHNFFSPSPSPISIFLTIFLPRTTMGALAYISVRAYVGVRVGEWGGEEVSA